MEFVLATIFFAFVVVFAVFFLALLITLNSAVERVNREAGLLRQRRQQETLDGLTPAQRAELDRQVRLAKRQEERNRVIYDGGGW